MKIRRREWIPLAGAMAAAGCSGKAELPPDAPGRSAVFIARANSYSDDLAGRIGRGLKELRIDVRGKNILLKPNLVEFDSTTAINTNVAVIAAAREAFRVMGAATVRIGEGPGHRRDTIFLAEEARYRGELEGFDQSFVDLNRDDVARVKGFVAGSEIYLPKTALGADLIVSLAKMKTHHWAGATLSMKNLFGLTPGAVYGWPKNFLHQNGVNESIVALNRIFTKTLAIVDGVVGMEGNGPIQGTAKKAGVLVMGENLVAVDSTCCRLMGIDPYQLAYLNLAHDLGHRAEQSIEQRGEKVAAARTPFELVHEFRHARL